MCTSLCLEIQDENIAEKIVTVNVLFLLELSTEQLDFILKENDIKATIVENSEVLRSAKISMSYTEVMNFVTLAQVQYIEKIEVGLQDYSITFIENIYSHILHREVSEISQAEITFWSDKINSEQSVLSTVEFFIQSEEFAGLNLSDEAFIKMLYLVFLGREADEGGVAYWLNEFDTGTTQKLMMQYFAFSEEFEKLTTANNLAAYTQQDQVSSFIERLYVYVLKRDSEGGGMDYWINAFNTGEKGANNIVMDFFGSDEFKALNLSNEEFVATAYKAIMGRNAEAGGLSYWVSELESGNLDKEALLNAFLYSEEFTNLANSYGIKVF